MVSLANHFLATNYYLFVNNVHIIKGMKLNKEFRLPVVFACITYLLSYQVPKWFEDISKAYSPSIALDHKIPFVPLFMIIYVLAFFQWINALLVIMHSKKETGYKYCSAIMIGSLIGFVIFLVYPTTIVGRPTLEPDSLLNIFVNFIFSYDTPTNAFPSFHCFCSTISVFAIKEAINNKKYTIFNCVFSILVFASTLFTKQHFIIDVPAGIILAIFSIYITKYINFNKLFDYLNTKFMQ